MFRVTCFVSPIRFGIIWNKKDSVSLRRLHDIQCTYIYGTCDVDRHTLHTPYRAVACHACMRPVPARVERACSCASFLQVACLTVSLFLTVP